MARKYYPYTRGDSFKHFKAMRAACTERREGDEMACTCGIRWATDEAKPRCLRDR